MAAPKSLPKAPCVRPDNGNCPRGLSQPAGQELACYFNSEHTPDY